MRSYIVATLSAFCLAASLMRASFVFAAEPIAELPARVFGNKWIAAPIRGNTFTVGGDAAKPLVTTTGRQAMFITSENLDTDTRVRFRVRFTDPATRSSIQFAAGLTDAVNLKDRGCYFSLTPTPIAVSWAVHDPNSTARTPETRGTYKPQFMVERSLSWPESLRANVEADMAASKPIVERELTMEIVLRRNGYDAVLDGIPLTTVKSDQLAPQGLARFVMTPNVELLELKIDRVPPADDDWVFRTVALDSVLNASQFDGQKLDVRQAAGGDRMELDGVPFTLVDRNAEGNDHVDVGRSWFRQGNLYGRYSGRGNDAMMARWGGAMMKDPARITLRLPKARYSALHLLAAADGDANEVPIVTAQFYRAQAGFPKSFEARVPALTASSRAESSLPVSLPNGRKGRLFRVTIPIDNAALAEFDDLDYVELELTKQVQLYRASPDPMYYSHHAAGLPSSVHIYALTTERPAVDVRLEASAYGHIWTAPERPKYSAALRNRRGEARNVELVWTVDGREQRQTVKLPKSETVTVDLPLNPKSYGHHTLRLAVVDGATTHAEDRTWAYLHEDTRERGNWDFGRGPLFGFWNWGGGHHTPSAEKQLLVMAKAGIETTPGSFEDYVARHGDEARKVMEKYKIFTLKFAGAGDHYVTARFAADLQKVGLEKARETFIAELKRRQSKAGPNSRPMFLSFYAEPSIGPVTHGIFPQYIGEPPQQFSDYETERYKMFLNGFVEGAKIVRENFPEVKCLLPHGDPAFVVHFLERNRSEVAPLLDGVCVDIPCFERLPEQQFHQVSLHRMYMARNEMKKAGIEKPFLPMYEGPCIPSGPGALTEEEQADLTIRSSLLLQVYGVDVQNGGFPGFDTASYWGEQHYGFGVMNRVSLETPKRAYTALATMTRHLNRANFEKWLPTGSQNVYALQFKHYKTGKRVHVLWTLRGRRPVTIAAGSGETIRVFDENDNEIAASASNGRVTFEIDPSPCYVEGLAGDAVIELGEPDHSDSRPAPQARKLTNFGDGSWQIVTQPEPEYETSHKPYIFRYPSPMTAAAVEAPSSQGGKALAVQFQQPTTDRVFVPYYSVLKPALPVTIPGKASHLGLWVKAAGDWGRAVYFCRDAKGELWINIGTRGAWNCDDLHSWTSFNFDGWRYLRMELPANSAYDGFREAGNAWWGPYSSGDGKIDLPLQLEKVVVERRTHVMYVDDPQPANRSDVLLGDLYAEYSAPADAGDEAIRLAAVEMPVPTDVKGLDNPIARLDAEGTAEPITIERITLPTQEADGTQCFVHFAVVPGAKQYDVWASPYADGRGALQLGKAWKEPGQLIRGLRANQDFYLFAAYVDAEGKTSRPSAAFKINLQDFFGMK